MKIYVVYNYDIETNEKELLKAFEDIDDAREFIKDEENHTSIFIDYQELEYVEY